nr:bifunctional methylenetetrahydrofolate dehydrogenase/methenyltetrahydrofolate cyclohydrolase FolD [Pasteuria penetrans]
MFATILDGRKVVATLRHEMVEQVAIWKRRGIIPCLAVIEVGEDPASRVYIGAKKRACQQVGIRFQRHALPDTTGRVQLMELIHQCNADADIHGIIVQLPLPPSLDPVEIQAEIMVEKDVDGLTPTNLGRLAMGRPRLVPCTPRGIIELLLRTGSELEGKHAVVVGRSTLVGQPMAWLLMQQHATVTVCHSRTVDLSSHTGQADILVVAAGVPHLITGAHVKPGAVVVDVGIHRTPTGTLCGDVDFAAVSSLAAAITPVPGGVGPMTVAMLLSNTLLAVDAQYPSGC